ncbi:hypothetical protein GUJ93_ZPchr0007g4715 [Zizania palustris]|uniref:Uncharacterized protein n=1 Tax=Zizania palustris TaxID=103762 RepID=A0A8J5VRD7_ZIZPA|nr:hypothetical protein GUJ93_ZPchr0007g4715 [Zizania palustris]
MEEFQEADVLWPADQYRDYERCRHHAGQGQPAARAAAPRPSSAPVRIPAAATPTPTTTGARPRRRGLGCDDDDDDDDGMRTDSAPAAAIVPPHVFVAARQCSDGRTVASSVCVGHGRTLKGRDLRAVRNAVLHMTGFLGSSDQSTS